MKEPNHDLKGRLICVARFPRLRVLAWSGDQLYASRGYHLMRATVQDPATNLAWQPVASFHPEWRRRLSVRNGLIARLFRDGFHALAVLPSGGLVAAASGAIVTLRPGETEFRLTHTIVRGTRPLHITSVPGGTIYWGNISTIPPATKSTSTRPPTPEQPGASHTHFPMVPSVISTTSFTTPGEIAFGY